MRLNKVVMTTLGVLLTSLAFAGNDDPWRLVATLSAGPAWSTPGESQTIYVQPELAETFAPNSTTQVFADGEMFLGLQHPVAQDIQGQLGLAVADTTGIPLNGDIWQDADPDFNNLSYNYKISHVHIAVKGKLLTDMYQAVQPYIAGSLGVGFNRAYQYSSTPKLFEVLPEPPFAPETSTAFTYTIGLGLQRALTNHWSIGVGYEFADWGKTSLGTAAGQVSDAGVRLNHVYTNELQFNLSFIA
jgi:opacity protein-like surface antigen